jgi:hypothetical protein
MIYKFQPFSPTKEIGSEYNAHCSMVPNPTDWILIMDYDAMVLDPRAYRIMELAIDRYPQVEIFGAYTNRIGYPWQRFNHMPDENSDIRYHLNKAKMLADRFPNGEAGTLPTPAGFFLLFRKSYWMENNFQPTLWGENQKLFDFNFALPAAKRDNIRIIKGVYVWHTYRLLAGDWSNMDHLK